MLYDFPRTRLILVVAAASILALTGTSLSASAQVATFSGRVTDQNSGLGIENVAIVAVGNQTGTRVAVSDAQGNYTLTIGANTNIKIRPYRFNFIFSPVLASFSSIGGFPITGTHPIDFTGAPLPFPILIFAQAPVLLTEDNSLQALALDSVFLQRDPFALVNENYFGSDKRTRINLLLVDLDLFSGEALSIITVQAVDKTQVAHTLPVENLRKVPNVPWMSQLTVLLPTNIATPNDLTITVMLRGLTSNAATIRLQ